ncbi:MAG: type III secretion system export apparatus subunit SctV [Bryobacterales bacterium]|nr:type III secretion system export apparatus subunit SctV [Bryobacterales bacterium]
MTDLTARWNEIVTDVKNGRMASVLTRSADLLLVAAIAAMVGLMIIPLPTWLLDIFLTINISVALTLLMVSVYIPNAVKIASYPTLLLITTLYRLSLDISATRLILLQADAGEVVASFGQFVVQGNFVVGAVIFLIITLVQFIVITKGAERVAEVAARFTLDAIPGKQMSIDADLRAGTLTYEQARAKREDLSRESQFYGAMDGAMKFVKGDAIAGIVITMINIIAGLVIGVAMHGMSAMEAVQVYSVLTIGSGLVSQIPALLISISAGMIITRVAAEGPDSNLGAQVAGQILAQPKAIGVAAGLMFIMALIPGLPKIPFFLLAGALGGLAYALMKPRVITEAEAEVAESAAAAADAPRPEAMVPVVVSIAPDIALSPAFHEAVAALRQSLYFDLGVVFPPVNVNPTTALAAGAFEIWLNEIPSVRGSIRTDCLLIGEAPAALATFGFRGDEGVHPLTGRPATWISPQQAAAAQAAGFTTWDPSNVLLLHLTNFLRRNSGEFIGLQEVHLMVERMRELYPNLVEQVVPKPVPVHLLTDILRRLSLEAVSIRDLKAILESLGEWARGEDDPIQLTERVRGDLKRRICHQLSRGDQRLYVYDLDPRLEESFRMAIRKTAGGVTFSMPTGALQEALAAARRAFGALPATAQNPVIVTERDIRRYVRQILSTQHPDLAVLSYDQLSPQITLEPMGRVA